MWDNPFLVSPEKWGGVLRRCRPFPRCHTGSRRDVPKYRAQLEAHDDQLKQAFSKRAGKGNLSGGWTTHLKNISQIRNLLPIFGVKIKNIWDATAYRNDDGKMNIEFADGWVASSMASRGNLSICQPVWKCQSNRTHFPQFSEKQKIFGQPPPYRRWILIMPCSSASKTMHYFSGELHWRLPYNLASSLIPTMGNFMTPAKERGWRKGMKMTRFRGACSTIPPWIQVMYGCLGADSIGIVLGPERATVTTHSCWTRRGILFPNMFKICMIY